MARSASPKVRSPQRHGLASGQDRQAEVRQIFEILHKWGIHTLGQLAALDKEELRARLGPQAVRLWERANGNAIRLLKFVLPPETFEESFEFEHEIETAEPLLFILRRFLEQLSARLSAIYLVANELTLRITFANPPQVRHRTDSSDWRNGSVAADKQHYERIFKIPQPTNDVDLLFRTLQTHLENFKSEHPIVAVALDAQPVKAASQQFGLFETALRNPQQLYETLARLTALLGSDRVGTPILEETHRPDAFRMEPFVWSPSRTGTIAADTAASTANSFDGHRPPLQEKPALRRFRPAAHVAVFTSENAHLQSDTISGQVVDRRGPFLLSGNWWHEKSWARAEWDLELDDGILLRAHETEGTWKIDGIYD